MGMEGDLIMVPAVHIGRWRPPWWSSSNFSRWLIHSWSRTYPPSSLVPTVTDLAWRTKKRFAIVLIVLESAKEAMYIPCFCSSNQGPKKSHRNWLPIRHDAEPQHLHRIDFKGHQFAVHGRQRTRLDWTKATQYFVARPNFTGQGRFLSKPWFTGPKKCPGPLEIQTLIAQHQAHISSCFLHN